MNVMSTGDEKYITVRPSDFINGPYVNCPKCGKPTFGIVCIAAHQYSRRCRSCYFPKYPERYEPIRLPALDKKIIYLDQFVISNMLYALNQATRQHGRNPHEDFYRELFARLDLLGKKQLLVCPKSEFHDYESMTTECSESLKDVYELLSYNTTWYPADSVHMRQIMKAFRKWIGDESGEEKAFTKDDFLYGDRTAWTDHFYVVTATPKNEELVTEIRQMRNAVAEELREVFETWRKDNKKTFHDWAKTETEGAARKYIKNFFAQIEEMIRAEEKFIATQRLTLGTAGAFLPTHETIVMMQLRDRLLKAGYAENEWLHKSCEFLRSPFFAELPFVKIGSFIWATVADRAAHSGQKRLPTRGFSNDVGFISTYLPHCDAMFVDKECHGILADTRMKDVLKEYRTRVFSLRNRAELFEYLDEIEASLDQEHLDLLNEVYGDCHLKPYLDLFSNVKLKSTEVINRMGSRIMDTIMDINYQNKLQIRFYGDRNNDRDMFYLQWTCEVIVSLQEETVEELKSYWGRRGPSLNLSDHQYVGFLPRIVSAEVPIELLPPDEFLVAAIEQSGHEIWINRDKVESFAELDFRELIGEVCAGIVYPLVWQGENLPTDEEWTQGVIELAKKWGFTGNLISCIKLR